MNIRCSSSVSVYKTVKNNLAKNKKNFSLLNTENKDKVSKNSENNSFLKNIFDQKARMNEILNKTKSEDLKRKLQLGEEKIECIKNIKDICSQNSKKLSTCLGYSQELDHILSGQVDTVTQTMNFNDVSKHIGNLEYSIAHNKGASLAQYYQEGADQHETFAQYMGDGKGLNIDEFMSSKTASDNQKDLIGVLEYLKTSYKSLYNVMDRIKEFNEESAERIKELRDAMQKNINTISKQDNSIIINNK